MNRIHLPMMQIIIHLAIIVPLCNCFTVNSWSHLRTWQNGKSSLFITPPNLQSSSNVFFKFSNRRVATFIQLAEDFNAEEESGAPSVPKRKKRIRRKDKSLISETITDAEEAELSGEEQDMEEPSIMRTSSNKFVEMEVPDIRAITQSGGVSPVDNEEYEYESDDGEEDEGVSVKNDDSLEGLLADAKRLRASKDTSNEEEGFSVIPIIKNVISTIVTVDFFIVCVLLLWFLTGVFSSYVLKADAIQVAFNGIFEPVVQPALGILMLASAAGGVMGDKSDEK